MRKSVDSRRANRVWVRKRLTLYLEDLMAIHEKSREDLLRDGKGFFSRGELKLGQEKVIVGFRKQDQIAIYFGEDPVFQFNAELSLRRVYFKGDVFRAEAGRLVQLTRTSKGGQVLFHSKPASESTLQELFSSLSECLSQIRSALQARNWTVVGEEPGLFLVRLANWMNKVGDSIVIAQQSGVQ